MIGARCNLQDRFAMKFLTLEGERLIYSTRQHWSKLIPVFALNILTFLAFAFFLVLTSIILPQYFFTLFIFSLVIIALVIELLIKQLVEWFFHFYIVTNRKIVEVQYRPMYSKIIHEVLLDQVRCTEVDVRARGFTSEVFNVGTVLITFDRPTNEKIFSIEHISEPRKVAMHLGDVFGMQKNADTNSSWVINPLINARN